RLTGYSWPDERPSPTDPERRRAYTPQATEQLTAISPSITKTVDGGATVNAVVGEVVDYQVVVSVPANINMYDTVITDVVPSAIAVSSVSVAYGSTWAAAPAATP